METSCGFVLVNHDCVLLLQYPQGHWGFVKGHYEEADGSYQQTALRELREETGIEDVRMVPDFEMRTEYVFTRKGREVRKQVFWYAAETDVVVVTLSHEHTGHLWLSWDEAAEQLTFDNSRNVLAAARAVLEGA